MGNINEYKEVEFSKFCSDCKYYSENEDDEHCAECLNHPVNLYSRTPVKFRRVKKKNKK